MKETNILVVDDEKEIADLLEIYLISDGFQVKKAYSAAEGLKMLEEQSIDLVLLDVMMPDMDGITMCRRIRETNNIPIIMVSAKTQELDKIVGLTNGADDYVSKPFNPLELMARVKSQLRRYRDVKTGTINRKEWTDQLRRYIEIIMQTDIIREKKLSAIMVTHNLRYAVEYGNRLIMMDSGRIIYDVSGEEKMKLTVEDLLHKFEEASGTEFANDRMMLSN